MNSVKCALLVLKEDSLIEPGVILENVSEKLVHVLVPRCSCCWHVEIDYLVICISAFTCGNEIRFTDIRPLKILRLYEKCGFEVAGKYTTTLNGPDYSINTMYRSSAEWSTAKIYGLKTKSTINFDVVVTNQGLKVMLQSHRNVHGMHGMHGMRARQPQ